MLRIVRLILEGIGLLTVVGAIVGVFVFLNLADLLQREDKPQKADFIFPLAGDFGKLDKAAQLYKQGFAPKIFMSDGYGRNRLTAAGVPSDAIVAPTPNLALNSRGGGGAARFFRRSLYKGPRGGIAF